MYLFVLPNISTSTFSRDMTGSQQLCSRIKSSSTCMQGGLVMQGQCTASSTSIHTRSGHQWKGYPSTSLMSKWEPTVLTWCASQSTPWPADLQTHLPPLPPANAALLVSLQDQIVKQLANTTIDIFGKVKRETTQCG